MTSLAWVAIAGCFTSPADRGSSSATSSSGGTSTSTGGSTSAGSTGGTTGGGCTVDSDCHKSNPDQCNICSDMRLVCDQGACVCACNASTGTTGSSTSGTTGSSTSGTSGTSGTSCWTDADCPPQASVSQYCHIAIAACLDSTDYVTPSAGVCHRDCEGGGCSCQSDEDCPFFGCDLSQGRCNQGGVFCPAAPTCAAGCAAASFAVEPCPFCLCAACPAPDAGSDACGGCGAGSTCCASSGGALPEDGGNNFHVACTPLEADGGCPPGAICNISPSGEIENCNFYYP